MKLNPDCIRDVMLYLEENLSITQTGNFQCLDVIKTVSQIADATNHTRPDIRYSLIQLNEKGYIVSDFKLGDSKTSYTMSTISFITPRGHDFLSSIHNEETWNKSKAVLSKFGSVSLTVIEAVSKGFADAALDRLTQSAAL